jgi:hypothetical protein
MADDGGINNDSSSNSNALGLLGDAAAATDTARSTINDDGAVAMDSGVANSISDTFNGGSAAIGGATANAGIEDSLVDNGGGTNNYNDDGLQVVNPAIQDVMLGVTNAKDTGKAQTGDVNAMDTGKAQDGQVNAMDSGVANANNQDVEDGAIGIIASGSAAIDTRIAEAEDDAAVGFDAAQVVSDPNDSAIAQGAGVAINDTDDSAFTTGAGSPALADNEDFAISQSGPALNDNEDFAISNSGPAYQDVDNAATVGAGNNVQDIDDSAVAQGSIAAKDVDDSALADNGSIAIQVDDDENAVNVGSGQAVRLDDEAAMVQGAGIAISDPADPVAINSIQANNDAAVGTNGSIVVSDPTDEVAINGNVVKDNGELAKGVLSGNNNNDLRAIQRGQTRAIQTVSLTELKQVNAGVYVGNGSADMSGAAMQVTTYNSSSTGLNVVSHNQGGVASNVAAQNVLNVTANITQ